MARFTLDDGTGGKQVTIYSGISQHAPALFQQAIDTRNDMVGMEQYLYVASPLGLYRVKWSALQP
jgi:hypothetical protein